MDSDKLGQVKGNGHLERMPIRSSRVQRLIVTPRRRTVQPQEPMVATVCLGAVEPSDEIHVLVAPIIKKQLEAIGLPEPQRPATKPALSFDSEMADSMTGSGRPQKSDVEPPRCVIRIDHSSGVGLTIKDHHQQSDSHSNNSSAHDSPPRIGSAESESTDADFR